MLAKPAADGKPTVVYWCGTRLGFVEHHVDGWHAYLHPLLDPATAHHCGQRGYDTRAGALHAIVSSAGGPNGDITLTATGLRCRASWWDDRGDQHHQTVELRSHNTGTWTAAVAGSPTTWIVSLSRSLHGLLEVRSLDPDQFCGHATNLYDAACLLITGQPTRPAP